MITEEDIQNLANLAQIEVEEGESARLHSSMEGILSYISEVREISVDDAAKVPGAGTLRNVFREDGDPHEAALYTEAVLGNVPKREGGYVKVRKIL